MDKNNDKSLVKLTQIEEGFSVIRFQNDTASILRETREMSSSYIQFHFCTKGRGDFLFNDGNYSFPVEEENNMVKKPKSISLSDFYSMGSEQFVMC